MQGDIRMKRLEEIDKNFAVNVNVNTENAVFYDCTKPPFTLYGIIPPNEEHDYFVRLDTDAAKKTSEGVEILNQKTAGARVRFKTNSSCIYVYSQMHLVSNMPHCAFTGSSGFDLYEHENGEERFLKAVIIPNAEDGVVTTEIKLEDAKIRDLTLNFPLYSGVKSLHIGLDKDAQLFECEPYAYEKPIVYYGSSITQGGCASRPGNSYQAMISRRFDCNYVNLGFSGCAKAEDAIAEYISGLDMSIFVYDYDHNAPDAEHLEKTHEKMFNLIRERNPELPIIIVSAPVPKTTPNWDKRFEVIKKTYDNAVNKGDKNVYLIDGRTIMHPLAGDSGTVDGCHPNDLGFYCMAQKIGDVIGKILESM